MKLLMISGDRSVLAGKRGPFLHTLHGLSTSFERIDVICPHSPKADSEARIPDLPQNVYFHPSPYGLWYQVIWVVRCGSKLIGLFHHDVITAHEYPPFYNGLGALTLKTRTKVPVALEVHHVVGHPRSASAAEAIGYVLSRLWLPLAGYLADGIRVTSKTMSDTLGRFGVPRKALTVAPAFYLDRSQFSKLQQPHAKPYDVVFCGRLVANKNLQDVLRAVSKLSHVKLLVIGDGLQRSACEKLSRDLDIAHRTEFVGWLATQHDVLHAILSAKIFVMNSLSEGGPRVALEAMACGMPIISTKVGVMPDVIVDGQTGVFTSGDPEDLAEKIKHLLGDEALRTRLGAAAPAVLDRFDGPALIAGYVRFLSETAAKK